MSSKGNLSPHKSSASLYKLQAYDQLSLLPLLYIIFTKNTFLTTYVAGVDEQHMVGPAPQQRHQPLSSNPHYNSQPQVSPDVFQGN